LDIAHFRSRSEENVMQFTLSERAWSTASLRSTRGWRCSQSGSSKWILREDCRLSWDTAKTLCTP